MDHAGERQAESYVKDCADGERAEDSDGHVALRILGFLRGGRHGVEADVGEEDYAGAAGDAGPSEGSERSLIGRHEWMPVRGCDLRMAKQEQGCDDDEGENCADLDEYDERIEVGGLAHSDDQDRGHKRDHEIGGEIENAASLGSFVASTPALASAGPIVARRDHCPL